MHQNLWAIVWSHERHITALLMHQDRLRSDVTRIDETVGKHASMLDDLRTRWRRLGALGLLAAGGIGANASPEQVAAALKLLLH